VLASACLLAACAGGDDPPAPTVSRPVATPTSANASPTVQASAEPTTSAALAALLVPGPTIGPPENVYFLNGADIWLLAADGQSRQLTQGLRIGPWAQTTDASRAAVTIYSESNGAGSEEIRLLSTDGTLSDPIYGPSPTSGVGGRPTIRALDWSWDNQRLAVAYSDGSLATLTLPSSDPFAGLPQPVPVATPPVDNMPFVVSWAPSGAGIAYLTEGDDDQSTLFVTPNDGEASSVTDPTGNGTRSIRVFDWLPGRGRLAFVDDASSPSSRLPGSIFTIAPDGTVMELLVSAGQFGPAAGVVALSASPDGLNLAFTVFVPDDQGRPAFHSLWILSIDSGERRQVPVEAGFRITDLWWSSTGLVWRGVDASASVAGDGNAYTGSEPFILGRFDPTNGATAIVFQSARGT
jgi:hypothetical protein